MKGKGKGYMPYNAKGYGKGSIEQKGKGKGVYNINSSTYAQHPQSYQQSPWAESYPPLMNMQQSQGEYDWNTPTFLCHLEETVEEQRGQTLKDWMIVKDTGINKKKRQVKKEYKQREDNVNIQNKFSILMNLDEEEEDLKEEVFEHKIINKKFGKEKKQDHEE